MKRKLTIKITAVDRLSRKIHKIAEDWPELRERLAKNEAERRYEEITERYRRFLRGEKP